MKRILSLMLALVLLIGLVPMNVLAAELVLKINEESNAWNEQTSVDWTNINTDMTHIICYGQSFSTGSDAPYYDDPTEDNVYVYGNIANSTKGTELKHLSASAGNQHPIISAGNVLAKQLDEAGIDTKIVLGSYGSGGKTIAQLMSAERQSQIKQEEGYSYDILSSGKYEIFQSSVNALAQYAKKSSQSISCPAVVYLQGETDQNTDAQLGYPDNPVRAGYGAGGDKEKYKEYMSRLKEDMQCEIMEQYGQEEKPLFIIYQVSGTYTRTQYSSINMAQIEFAKENNDVILVQSPYFTSHYTNSHHLTQNGYRWLGEYIGRSIYTALVEHKKTWPMLPESIEITGSNSIRIIVNGVQNGLSVDTWTVEDASNSKNLYGFYLQVDGKNVVPSKISVQDNIIDLTLPADLVAETVYLYYAGKNASGTGNIRDNNAELGFYEYLDDSNDTGTGNNQGVSHSALDENGKSIIGQKYPMYNWLASFCYEVEVPEIAQKKTYNYHWKMQGNELVSVTEGNAVQNNLTLMQGSVESDVLNKAQYSMDKGIALEHERPWVIEWKAAGNGNNYGGGKFLSTSGYDDSCAQYLYLPADTRGLVAWGVSSDSANYGFQLGKLGIDTRKEHIYRIENRIDKNGENTIYLIVDGVEIGAMNIGYRTSTNSSGSAGSMIEEPNNWANGKNIYMSYIGASGSFALSNMKLSYLRIWENGIISITQQPEDVQQEVGKKMAVTVKAEGEGLKYQWYVKEAGAKEFKVSVNKTSSYAYTMQSYMHNRQVYCVITDAYGNQVTTETATITRPPVSLRIISQPEDVELPIGEKFSIRVKAEGDGLKYQWYYKESYMKEFAVSSNKSSAYSYEMTSYRHMRQVYCVITDQYGNQVTTDVATIRRPPTELKILVQTKDAEAVVGQRFGVSASVQGDGLTYQWYYKDAGMKEFRVSSNKTSAYNYAMASYMNNRQVYCVITDQYGNQVITDIATIRVK